MEAGGALATVLVAGFSLPCLLFLLALGKAGLRAAAAALRGGGGLAWPTSSAFLGYHVARPADGGPVHPGSVFRDDDDEPPQRGRGRPDPECVFCLSAVGDGEEVRELRCRHVFHRTCLDAWLARPRATCPLCRDRLLPADDPPRVAGGGYGFDDGALPSSVYAHGGALWHMT